MKASLGMRTIVAAIFCLLLGAPDLSAQQGVLSTEQLARQADVVAIGKVATAQCEWNAKKTQICTRVTISVSEYLKGGGSTREIVILTPGGEIGDVGEWYSGAARFQLEEEVVVFTSRRTPQENVLTGGAQGKLTVTHDTLTGARSVASGIQLNAFVSQVKAAVQAIQPEEK